MTAFSNTVSIPSANDGTLKVISSCPRFDVVNFEWKGQDHYRVLQMPAEGVTAIVVRKDKKFVMVRQTRPFFEKPLLEFVSGGVNECESAHKAIGREVFEETGYFPCSISEIREYSPNPALVLNKATFYEVLVENDPLSDSTEKDMPDAEVVVLTLTQILESIRSGEIHFTPASRFFYYLFIKNQIAVQETGSA